MLPVMQLLLANAYGGKVLVTDKDFDSTIKDNELVLIDFWAEWCGPCKKVSPILDEISESTGLLIGKLNIDENPEKTQEYAIHSIPTMVLFKNGIPVHTVNGAKPKHLLLKELSEWI
jgi:thioredoxin 1